MSQNYYNVQMIPLSEIYSDDEFNCRGGFSALDCLDLKKDIQENKAGGGPGLLNPIQVREWKSDRPGIKYRIVAGHRRYMAFRILERDDKEMWGRIPAMVIESESNMRTIEKRANVSENLRRKQLNILQEARAIQPYLANGVSIQVIADELGVTPPWVYLRKDILELPEDIQNEIAAGYISQDQIKQLKKIPTHEGKRNFLIETKERKLRGEKRNAIAADPRKMAKAKARKQPRGIAQIIEMQGIIQEALGNSLTTRALAWAAGEIDELSMYESIKAECDARDFEGVNRPTTEPFKIPDLVIAAGEGLLK